MPRNPVGIYQFSRDAFYHAQLVTKTISLLLLGVILFLARDIPEFIRAVPKPKLLWKT